MKIILTDLLICIVMFNISLCGNTSYFKLQEQNLDPITIEDGNLIIINKGEKSGKSIVKFVKLFEKQVESEKMVKLFEKITEDFRCSITKQSIVCLIFGNEIQNLNSRIVEQDKSSAVYKMTVKKFQKFNNVLIEFKIVDSVDSLDKDTLQITGGEENHLNFIE